MAANAPIPNFDAATAVTQTSPHTYDATFADAWCVGSVPNGGYVTSTIQRAAALHFATTLAQNNQPHLLTAHVEFLRRTSQGRATITISHAKLGRQTSTVHISLAQRDPTSNKPREEVVGYLTHTNMAALSGPTVDMHWALRDPPPLPAPTNLRTVSADADDADPNWELARVMPFPSFRKATQRVRWLLPRVPPQDAHGAPGSHTEVADVWMGLSTRPANVGAAAAAAHERWTTDMLGFAVDMFPQPLELRADRDVYRQSGRKKPASSSFWYPTVLLNLEVKKALPREGVEWLFMRVMTHQVRDGRYNLDVTVLDEAGDLVALSQHVCFAMPASRNLSDRGSHKKEKL